VQCKQRVKDVSWPSSSWGNYIFPDPEFTLQCQKEDKKKREKPKPFSVAVIINLIHLMASFSVGKKQIIVCRASLLGHCTFNL